MQPTLLVLHSRRVNCANWVTAIATALQSLPHKRGIIRTTRHWHTLGTPMAHTNGNVCCLGGIELNTHVHPRHARGPPLPCWRWSTGHAWMDLNSCLQHAPSYPHMLRARHFIRGSPAVHHQAVKLGWLMVMINDMADHLTACLLAGRMSGALLHGDRSASGRR